MKIRKEISRTKIELRKEIHEYIDEHDCGTHYQEGMACVICALTTLEKPLALLQYLRSRGMCSRILQSEMKLLDLLGEEELKRRMTNEVEVIRNIPKKRCFNCNRVVAVWMPYSMAATYVNTQEGRRLRVECGSCGQIVYFDKDEIKVKTKRRRKGAVQRILASNLARKFGYTEHSYKVEEDENHDEDNNEDEDSED